LPRKRMLGEDRTKDSILAPLPYFGPSSMERFGKLRLR